MDWFSRHELDHNSHTKNYVPPEWDKPNRGRFRWNLHVILLKFQWSFQFQCIFGSAIVILNQRIYLILKVITFPKKFLHMKYMFYMFVGWIFNLVHSSGLKYCCIILIFSNCHNCWITHWMKDEIFSIFYSQKFLQIFNILNHNSYRIKIKCIFWTKRHFS